MKKLLNFSNPLGDRVRQQIEELEGPFAEIVIPVEFDTDQPLWPQVSKIEAGPHEVSLTEADMVIPPAFSPAAFLLAADHLSRLDSRPRVVWLKVAGLGEWVLGGIE